MRLEIEKPSTNSRNEVGPRLEEEIKIRENDSEAIDTFSRQVVAVESASGWLVRLILLILILAASGIYVGDRISAGWVPADDGTLSQSALRVLQGQLPHRDFTEIYTGGLSLLHALAFRAFGVNLMSLRLCAFLFFLMWIPAVYYIGLRFVSAIGAGLITLMAVAWSYPNYPAAMPSWYNLFFATFGAAALLRYLDIRRERWLFVTGVCGGISLLVKIIGAYYIAGALLFLAFLEQTDHESNKIHKSSTPYRIFSIGALLLFLGTVIYLLHARLGSGELYHFVMPSVVLVGLVVIGERNYCDATTRERFRKLLKLLLPFAGGVMVPLIAFLIPYGRTGAVRQLYSAVISSAIARSSDLGVLRPAGFDRSIYALILVGVVAAAIYWSAFRGKLVSAAVVSGLSLLLFAASSSNEISMGVWLSVAMLTPLIVLIGAASMLESGEPCVSTRLQRQRLMVLISIAAVCSVVQYPFAAPIYLCYSLPLTLLAGVAIVATARKQVATYVLAAVAGFYILFAAIVLVPDHIYELTHRVGRMEELPLQRGGGLRIENAAGFTDLVHFLQQHSPNGLMYAGNDCPELYFLSGLKNVTRDDGGASTPEVLQAIQSADLKVVVINEAPFFPLAKMDPKIRSEVTRQFLHDRRMGIFHVFWRE